jgi:hypothetical protein
MDVHKNLAEGCWGFWGSIRLVMQPNTNSLTARVKLSRGDESLHSLSITFSDIPLKQPTYGQKTARILAWAKLLASLAKLIGALALLGVLR